MGILRAGDKIREGNFIRQSEKNVTPANDADKVPRLETTGKLHPDFIPFEMPNVLTYTNPTVFGSSTTQFDITNPSGTTFRYTWDATGTDPLISATTVPVGRHLYINGQNFNAANNGAFVVTGSGANYFEVTNASGVVESNKTIGAGAINYAYIPTPGVRFIKAIVQAAGGGSGRGGNGFAASGSAGGYTEDFIDIADIGAYQIVGLGKGGAGGSASPTSGQNGGNSYIGSLLVANGGQGTAQNGAAVAGGTVPTPGYFAVAGGNSTDAADNDNGSATAGFLIPCSAMSYLSVWEGPIDESGNDRDYTGPMPKGYGYGGAIVGQDSQPSAMNGVAGGDGIVIIIEYF